MAITNPTVTLPAGRTAGGWLRRHFGWIFTGLGVVAAVVLLTVLMVDRDAASTDVVEPGVSAVPRESITAIDHRAGAEARASRDSITAIDHQARTGD